FNLPFLNVWKFPDTVYLSQRMAAMRQGFSLSLLSFGSGLLVGWRICLAMAIGMATSWFILPPYLASHGMIPEASYAPTLRWVMWPATGVMVSGGLMALFLKWNLIVKTFRTLKGTSMGSQDFPIKWVVLGSLVLTVILCITQYFSMHIPIW